MTLTLSETALRERLTLEVIMKAYHCLWYRNGDTTDLRGVDSARDVLVAALTPRAYAPSMELDNHHNALLCPYCNPKGLKFEAAPPVPVAPPAPIVQATREAAARFGPVTLENEKEIAQWVGQRLRTLAAAPPAPEEK